MASLKMIQTNFTSGVLDEKLAAREDIAFYYNGLRNGVNGLIMPQGGFTARPGMQYVRELRKILQEISLSGATLSAPQGGTAANISDGNATTYLTTSNPLSTTNPFVIAQVQFASAQSVMFVDVINIKLASGSLDGELRIQYSNDGSTWSNFDNPFNIDATDRSRRRGVENSKVSAIYWRLVRIGATSIASAVSVSGLKFWTDTSALSNVRLVPFAYSTTEAYMMATTAGNIDVLVGDNWKGSIAIDHTSVQLPKLGWTQSLDTLLLFQSDVQPPKIFRQGGDDEFDFRAIPFENIPKYDYGAGTGGVNEVQMLNDGASIVSGNKFTILLEGERTKTITAGASRAATATAIQTALRDLNNTSATGITVADSTDGFTVTFGGDDGAQEWGEMSVSVMSGTSIWSVSRLTKGEEPGEAIMSSTRGWPRAGTFHQSRLFIGGITGRPDALIGSCLGDYYNLDINRDDDTKALMFKAETDQVGAIYGIVAGRHLSLFTNDGEFFFNSEAIKDDSPLKLTTRSGSKEGLRIHEVDGALVFVQGVRDDEEDQEIGTSIREFIFVDTEQSYQANLLSKLSSHLIKNPVDVALRKALSTDEADILLIVNDDGSGANFTMLRGDAVNAFMPCLTRSGDKIIAVGVDKKRRVYFATERIIGGVTRRFLERWNDQLLLDCGTIVNITAETLSAGSNGQATYNWTFTNPVSAEAIGVRLNGGRLDADQYSVNLGTKSIELTPVLAAEIVVGDEIRISSMIDQISGLDHLNGETVMVIVDGSEKGQVEVSAGNLSVGVYADTQIQYGFDYPVEGELMPLRIPNSETLAGEKVRCHEVIAQIYKTGGLELQVNGGAWREVPLQKLDTDVLDRSTTELTVSGEVKLSGLLGHAIGASVKFRRPGPVPFTLLGLTRKVQL